MKQQRYVKKLEKNNAKISYFRTLNTLDKER